MPVNRILSWYDFLATVLIKAMQRSFVLERPGIIGAGLWKTVAAYRIHHNHGKSMPEFSKPLPIGFAQANPRFLRQRLLLHQPLGPGTHFRIDFRCKILVNQE